MFQKSTSTSTGKLSLFIACGAAVFALTACGGDNVAPNPNPVAAASTSAVAPASQNAHEIHLETMAFAPASITIRKGESVVLVNDTFMPHTVSNGTWNGTTPAPAREPGAPELNELRITANNYRTVGPFDTAGTFQLYCPLHPKMNLTVVVE